jgi:mannonate dehydratase
MYYGYRLRDASDEMLAFAKQTGADGGLLYLDRIAGYGDRGYPEVDELAELRERFERHGLGVLIMVLDRVHLTDVMTGREGRDREIEDVCRTLEAMGKVGLGTFAFDIGVHRGSPRPGMWRNPNGRGGAVLSSFDYDRALAEMDAPVGRISSEEAWERVGYLYERIVPVAEAAKVNLACHPSDPPMPHYRGVEQILNTADGLKKLTEEIMPSERNGLLFCIGTMAETGTDIYQATEYFLQRGRVFVTHFRNVRGTIPRYDEVFLDEGDIDMYRIMQLYVKYDHRGTLVPDHSVGITSDTSWGHISRSWSLSYMMALQKAAEAHAG